MKEYINRVNTLIHTYITNRLIYRFMRARSQTAIYMTLKPLKINTHMRGYGLANFGFSLAKFQLYITLSGHMSPFAAKKASYYG